jgi:hypothetical protein
MVDLQKGERYEYDFWVMIENDFIYRQMNTDCTVKVAQYSALMACGSYRYSIYDCLQWWIHWGEGRWVTPVIPNLEISLWQLGKGVTHQTLAILPGSGQIDGEIMETLWAKFNKFGRMTRSMTKAHRSEILNDHKQDVNHKKLIGMGLFTALSFYCSDG